MFFDFAEIDKQRIQLVLWNSYSIILNDNVKTDVDNFSLSIIWHLRLEPIW